MLPLGGFLARENGWLSFKRSWYGVQINEEFLLQYFEAQIRWQFAVVRYIHLVLHIDMPLAFLGRSLNNRDCMGDAFGVFLLERIHFGRARWNWKHPKQTRNAKLVEVQFIFLRDYDKNRHISEIEDSSSVTIILAVSDDRHLLTRYLLSYLTIHLCI